MPTYTFQINETGEYFTELMPYSELEKFIADHPELTYYPGAPMIVSGRDGGHRVDSGFKDLTKEMRKAHPRGNFGSYLE